MTLVSSQLNHFKAGLDQNIALHASPTAKDLLLSKFYLPGPFTFIFLKPLPTVSCFAVADAGSRVGLQNKIESFKKIYIVVTDDR